MPTSPLVSIVMPVFNDEDWITGALESCLDQTLDQIEVICVDDASTDATVEIIERHQEDDRRIRLIRQEENRSAFQARRAGVLAATAPYILFLDGDDELDPRATAKAVAKAQDAGADLVGFGISVLGLNGQAVAGYQKRLQPAHATLEGTDILRTFFPVGKAAQGQLWRFLFTTELLRSAYALFPEDLVLPRVNDLPITFIALASAHKYVPLPDHLYRYYFRRGGSGHRVEELSQFEFYAGSIDSTESMAPAVRVLARRSSDPEPILDSFETARRSIIGNILKYLVKSSSEEIHGACLTHLHNWVSASEIVLAAAEFAPDALPILTRQGTPIELEGRSVQNVLLTTKALTTGGVSNVVMAQAHCLTEAGYTVTIAARRPGSVLDGLPEGVHFVELSGKMPTRLARWAEICKSQAIDVVIDHQILYSKDWATYAEMARALGVPTIGWVHSFALRPVHNLRDTLSFITRRLNALSTLVTLSPLDASFWTLQGAPHAVHLPNPPSPLLREAAATSVQASAPDDRLELIWWGRIEEHTKQVSELIVVASQLRQMGVDFHLAIIGPDSVDCSAEQLLALAEKHQVGDSVDVIGPLHGQELLDAIDAAHVFVSTSIIEGYQLTLAEAQARGLPVAMYELPWLSLVQDNHGIMAAPQGDAEALARGIATIAEDPDYYSELSRASLEASQRALSPDFSQLYEQLITGTLPEELSPEPTLEDAQQIIDWMIFYTERHAGLREKLAKASVKKRTVTKSAKVQNSARPKPRESDLILRLRPAARKLYRYAPFMRPVGHRVKRAGGKVKRRLNLDL